MKHILLYGMLIGSQCIVWSQNTPKLVVGIVVDQMRYDMLKRNEKNFTENGLKRLMREGFFAENMHYNYAPTYTGPGHTSIYTGTTPAVHGIAANNWLNYGTQSMYCSQDDSVTSVGGDIKAGKMSPKNMKTTTVTDQLRLASSMKSKVIGVALKDRGAIFPAGHLANAAYWYDSKTGNWITSSYYSAKLPLWVDQFNQKNYPYQLLQNGWNLLLDSSKYDAYSCDNKPWEEGMGVNNSVTFPHFFLPKNFNDEIRVTPMGNTLTTMLALEALRHEEMGKGSATDFLAISYSSTDYIGHMTGPYSLETEDAYIRLDRDIEKLISAIDQQVGKDNYWIWITADHGVQDVPAFDHELHIPGGQMSDKKLKEKLNGILEKKYAQKDIIMTVMNEQITLNRAIQAPSVAEVTFVLNQNIGEDMAGIVGFYDFEHIATAPIPSAIREKLINGYSPRRSGDIAVLLAPNWMSHGPKGTTHGSPYNHDSHVPFILYGKGIKSLSSDHRYHITDIAPTLSYMLGILQPNGCIGNPITEIQYNVKK